MEATTLKAELKEWERAFEQEHGRKPTIEDIKRVPQIAAKYKQHKHLSNSHKRTDTAAAVIFNSKSRPERVPIPPNTSNPFSPTKRKSRRRTPPIQDDPASCEPTMQVNDAERALGRIDLTAGARADAKIDEERSALKRLREGSSATQLPKRRRVLVGASSHNGFTAGNDFMGNDLNSENGQALTTLDESPVKRSSKYSASYDSLFNEDLSVSQLFKARKNEPNSQGNTQPHKNLFATSESSGVNVAVQSNKPAKGDKLSTSSLLINGSPEPEPAKGADCTHNSQREAKRPAASTSKSTRPAQKPKKIRPEKKDQKLLEEEVQTKYWTPERPRRHQGSEQSALSVEDEETISFRTRHLPTSPRDDIFDAGADIEDDVQTFSTELRQVLSLNEAHDEAERQRNEERRLVDALVGLRSWSPEAGVKVWGPGEGLETREEEGPEDDWDEPGMAWDEAEL